MALAGFLCALLPVPSAAQVEGAWNSDRVMDLVERARATRAEVRGSEGLESYAAEAEGHIYFFVDPAEGERALIRVDQVALDMYWMAPDFSKQVIVGMREETRLPVRDFHYFVDRLTVVQNNFEDMIQIGEGNDVAGAPHPLAVRRSSGRAGEPEAGGRDAASAEYDYRLADSVTVRLYGREDPVRVYRVEVRPTDTEAPGVVGSVYLDRESAAIVRMEFTFTPSSYRDRRNDWIRISIDHGLWEGRHWLPNEQRIEVRRELPELDIGAGTVIRAVMRITDYDLNVPLDEDFFAGLPVVARPVEVREQHPFREGLLERIAEEGLQEADRELDPREIRARAAELMRQRVPSGLPPLRLHLPGLSSALRFNRAEGLFLGAGGIYVPDARFQLRAQAGFAFGPSEVSLHGEARSGAWSAARIRVAAWRNRLYDIGPTAGSSGLTNTIAGVTAGRDYLDPYFANGAGVSFDRSGGGLWVQSLALAVDEHRSAEWSNRTAPIGTSSEFRPVRPIEEGTKLAARLELRREGDPLRQRSYPVNARIEGGSWEGSGFARAELGVGATRRSAGYERALELALHAGTSAGETPPQHLFLLGGRQTLPGFSYRGFAGRHYARLFADASTDLGDGRWLRLHALGWAGWAHLPAGASPPLWEIADTDGVRASLGAGVGIFYDILRFDVARGLNGGGWQGLVSIDPRWWDRL